MILTPWKVILWSNPPPFWNFLGLWPPHPPGISNSLRGGGLDIFWNHTFQGKARFDGKKPNWSTLAKSKNIQKLKTYHKPKTVVKSSVKWDTGTGKCFFMLIFGVLVATSPNCFIVLWKILVLWKLILQKHFVIAKGLQKQSKQCQQSVLLDDVIKLWSPKW